MEALRKQSEQGARMGYTGKQVIHPAQVPVVQEAFLPSKQQVDWAKGLLAAFESHQKSGKVSFYYRIYAYFSLFFSCIAGRFHLQR